MILMTKCFAFSVVLIMALFVSSCSDLATGTRVNPVTVERTSLSTVPPANTPTPRLLPTETRVSPTPLLSMKMDCVGESNEVQKLDLTGVVVLNEQSNQQSMNFGFYLLDLRRNRAVKAVKEGTLTAVALDRKHLAYRYRSSDKKHYLRVLDSSGKTISDFPLRIDGRFQLFFNWQNAEQLRTLQPEKDWRLAVQLLNPFTQEHTVLRTNWDEVYIPKDPIHDKVAQWQFDQQATEIFFVYGANILYDPTLTRVVYPKDNGIVSLVDVETEKELASAKLTDWGRLPSWSPNGQYLTILNREGHVDEFYLVLRDGDHFERITDFSKEWGTMSVFEYSWSPDSRQVAFWLNPARSEPEDGVESELAILDIATRQVTRLCIQGISVGAAEPWMMGHPEPIWSPDSRYIMITQWDDPVSPRKYSVLVIDTVTGLTQKISENTAPIGWMVAP